MGLGVDIIVPAGPGDCAWRGLLPQLDPANANSIVLALAEDDSFEIREMTNGPSFQRRLGASQQPNGWSSSSCSYPGNSGAELDPSLRREDEQRIVQRCLEEMPNNLQVCKSKAGRAIQLNAGARASESAWLWFVHADSRVTPATLSAMQRFVSEDAAAIGYFRLRFLDDGPRLTVLNAWGAHFRSRVLGLPFGDQGLLMPRRIFDALGGFNESVAAGEDHDLIWSARARGIPLIYVDAPILTSARKYAARGWWRTTREHLGMTRDQARCFSRRHAQPDPVGPS